MDANITIKFYRVTKPNPEAENFETVLAQLFGVDLTEREVVLDEGIILRLERLETEATFRAGEFCRIQRTNIPPSAGPDGLTPTVLEGGKGLGHLAAFRYHVPTRIICLQVNQNCANPTRIALYLSVAQQKPLYTLIPVLREDALARIGNKEIRAFSVRFAEPDKPEALDDPKLTTVKGIRRAAKLLNARDIEIKIGAGRSRKKHMRQQPIRAMLRRLARLGSVDGLSAGVALDKKVEWFDLLEEQLKETEKLELPSDDTEENYEVRNRFIARTFNANMETLVKLFGPRQNGND